MESKASTGLISVTAAFRIPGDSTLPTLLQENHFEIRLGAGMTRNQFKAALKALSQAAGG